MKITSFFSSRSEQTNRTQENHNWRNNLEEDGVHEVN